MNTYYVYIMSNRKNGVLYTGMTNDIGRRVREHKDGMIPGFTQRYKLKKLVFLESVSDVNAAIMREKQIKGWVRVKKINLIETMNPDWNDLAIEYGLADF